MSESAVSAKRGWGSFGAKAAQSETSVRARPSGVHPEEDEVGKDCVAFRLGLPRGPDYGMALQEEE